MYRVIIMTILLLDAAAASAADRSAHRTEAKGTGARSTCMIEVLHSEELPGAPIFQNRVRARLRISPPGQPPFETIVQTFIPWQEPPPRRGQRLHIACDPAVMNTFAFY